MRLVIEEWWEDLQNNVRRIERPPLVKEDCGWKSVREFQRARLPHYKNHPYEHVIKIPRGFILREKVAHYGYRVVQRVTLEDPSFPVWVFAVRRKVKR